MDDTEGVTSCSAMKHPISVVTNAVYVVAGIGIALSGHWAGAWTGTLFVVLGIGSSFFHYYLPRTKQFPEERRIAQLMDEKGMYLAFGALAGANFGSVLTEPVSYLVFVAMVAGGIFLAAKADRPWADSFYVLPPMVILMLVGVWWHRGWDTAVMLFAGYLAIELWRELPEHNFWTPPKWLEDLYDPIHGIWHLGTGVLMYLSFP